MGKSISMEHHDFNTEAAEVVGKALTEATADPEAGAADWSDLDEEVRAQICELGLHAIQAFVQFAAEKGVRMVSAQAVPIPESDEEAAAMMAAVKVYTDGKRRKGGLVASAGLIVPGHVNGRKH